MNQSIKCMKLDFLLLKPYLKSMLLVFLVPLIFPFLTGTLFDGLSFAVTVMAMTTGYTFSVVEKNNLDRFYGFLPVKRSALVHGRYLLVFLMGFASLLFTVTAQVAILYLRGAAPTMQTILVSSLLCAGLFCIYAGVQLPGYYRFGSIKGKMLTFIPTIGFLLFYSLVKALGGGSDGMSFVPSNTILVIGSVVLMAFIIALSAAISTKVVQKGNR